MSEQMINMGEQPRRKGIAWWGWALIALGVVVALCLVGVFIIALAGDPATDDDPQPGPSNSQDVISNSNNEQNPPVDDVELVDCTVDQFGYAQATLAVTNNSSKTSSYSITVEIVDGDGNRLEEAYAFIDSLRPGQSSETEATGLGDVSDASGVDCALLTVDRYSAEG
jgi:hypothetical protein